MLCTSRAFGVDCMRSEADCCVVANVLICLPVAHDRLARSERLAGSGCVGVEPTNFWSA